ncbi:MAG: response regulator [Candidatus Xenobia bacterium]
MGERLAVLPSALLSNEADRPSVLVVDDDRVCRSIACKMLMRMGCRVTEAVDGLDALRVVSQRHVPIHLVLTDVNMPRLDAGGLLPRLQASLPGVPVLLVSACDETDLEAQGLRGLPLVRKPYTYERLAHQVQALWDAGWLPPCR